MVAPPPDQDGEADEASYSQLKAASQSQALVLMGDFNHPDICWEGYTARHVQSRRFLQCIDDNFLTQVVEKPTRRGVLLDLVLTNKEGLVEDVKDWCIPKSKKSGKGSRRPAWLSRELLKKLKWKKEVYSAWKKGLTTQEDYKNAVRVCRDEMRKAKASLELNLAKDVKVNRKGFFEYIGGKRKTRENVGPLLNETGAMVTEDAEKVELLNAFFASVFSAQASPQESQTFKVTEKVWMKEDFPLVKDDQVREQSWRTAEVSEDWRKANARPVFKKVKKEDPEKMMERLILGIISKYVEEKKAIRSSRHGFTKEKSCLTNPIAFFDSMTGWTDEGRLVDVVYLDFSKAFNTISFQYHLLSIPASS
ncbi:glycerol kinase [Limosa lapponica baueri]|uniref:Glycerol kinase n=1 Tax=Limosa lapponica baueri TaxID=1758121 RepID=A0A2I0UFD7_LIMLA|nr:glycerol kinase [Limosa lapponica baueri]